MKYIISCRSLIPSTLKHLKLRCKTINVDRSCAPWVEKAVHLEWSPTDPVILAKCEMSVAQQLQPWHGFNLVDDKAEYDSAFAVQYFREEICKTTKLISLSTIVNYTTWQYCQLTGKYSTSFAMIKSIKRHACLNSNWDLRISIGVYWDNECSRYNVASDAQTDLLFCTCTVTKAMYINSSPCQLSVQSANDIVGTVSTPRVSILISLGTWLVFLSAGPMHMETIVYRDASWSV